MEVEETSYYVGRHKGSQIVIHTNISDMKSDSAFAFIKLYK